MRKALQGLWWPAFLGLMTFGLAILTRTAVVNEALVYDEYYHFLPAQSFLIDGTYRVLDGTYERAAIFTKLVAMSFEIMGRQDPGAARLIPSVIPGALLVVLVFLWTRKVVGATAGWLVLVFVLLWPNGIEISQFSRFYALQGVLFVSGALLVYGSLADRLQLRYRILMLVASIPLLLLAIELQILTLIGLGAIGIWVVGVLLPGWLKAYRWLWWFVLAISISVIAILASGIFDNTINKFWNIYRWAPWPQISDPTYYHRYLRDNYPTFWPLFPIAALIALRAHPQIASFCLIIFVTAIFVQSFALIRGIRYIYSSMPFFFIIWAIALQAILPKFLDFTWQNSKLALSPFIPDFSIKFLSIIILTMALLFFLNANAGLERALKLTQGQPANTLFEKRRWAWPEAKEMVTPWLSKGAVIVTSEEMLAVKWLGDFDIGYNRPRFSELQFTIAPDVPPFTPDLRTGRPMIGLLEDLEKVIVCEPVGIFITNIAVLNRNSIGMHIMQVATRSGASTSIERGESMALIGWQRKDVLSFERDCADFPTLQGSRAAERINAHQ